MLRSRTGGSGQGNYAATARPVSCSTGEVGACAIFIPITDQENQSDDWLIDLPSADTILTRQGEITLKGRFNCSSMMRVPHQDPNWRLDAGDFIATKLVPALWPAAACRADDRSLMMNNDALFWQRSHGRPSHTFAPYHLTPTITSRRSCPAFFEWELV